MMHWSSWSAFWDMGGYAFYVWASFGVTFLLIALEVWQARQSWRLELRLLSDAIQIEEGLSKRANTSASRATLTKVGVSPQSSPFLPTESAAQTAEPAHARESLGADDQSRPSVS
jgi:heme exporter protein D